MTWLNGQTARVVPDHPLAAATKSVIGCVYVQAGTGGQRLGPPVGVAVGVAVGVGCGDGVGLGVPLSAK